MSSAHFGDKTSDLGTFIQDNRADMIQDLTDIVADLQRTMAADPSEFTEPGCDDPSIDIRLCLDLADSNRPYGWIFRTGLVDYDVYHSQYCAALSVQTDTDPVELLTDLINQLEE